MPFGDRTGPWGQGPMTGGARGYCAGYDAPGTYCPWPPRAYGAWGGRGRGAHHRHWYYATGLPRWARGGYPPAPGYAPVPSPDAQAAYLEDEAGYLREQLETIEEQIAELRRQRRETRTASDDAPAQ